MKSCYQSVVVLGTKLMVWEFFYGGYSGSTLDNLIFTFFIFTFAANLGSFLNVLVYRIPLGKSVVFG